MFSSKRANNKTSKLHGKALRVVYNDESSFDELLEEDHSSYMHHQNIQTLAI